MQSGIYEIVNVTNGKRYVGSAKNFKVRWASHISQLNLRKHHSIALQRAWILHGAEKFSFHILLVCKIDDLLLYEQIFIDGLKPQYNICPIAGSSRGRVTSEATKQKLRSAITGIKRSEETKKKLSDASRGRVMPPVSAETRARKSAALRGKSKKPRTEEHTRRLAAAKRKLSAEQVSEIRILLAGGGQSQQSIASRFNCSGALICLIASGKSYKGIGQ